MTSTVLSEKEKLQQAVHYKVSEICEGIQEESGITFSKTSLASIAELTLRQATIFCADLEFFSKHAKRKTITVEDVLLLARRSPQLQQHLRSINKKK